jgi:glycosyltransferase involved in cell wall biosynthesis
MAVPQRTVFLASYPPDGGVGEHVISIVRGLDPELWRFEVACLPGSLIELEIGGLPNVGVHHLKGRHPRPHLRDALDLPQMLRLVGSADIVHAHSSKAGFLVRFAAAMRRRRARTLFTPHAWSFWAAAGAEGRAYSALERIAAKWCRTIVTVSESERNAGIAAKIGHREQYRVIPNGIDPEIYSRDPAPVPGRIVMVGRLSKQKRPDIALRTIASLLEIHPGVCLDIAGDGPLRSETEALLAQLGLAGSVRLLGTRTDIPDLLAEAACFLLTSDYEGCPLSILEAMAAGVPVVATDVGGVGELVVVGETGYLVEPGRPDRLAAALSEVLANDERARVMGRAGRRVMRERFSCQRMLAEVEALYEEVADVARNASRE